MITFPELEESVKLLVVVILPLVEATIEKILLLTANSPVQLFAIEPTEPLLVIWIAPVVAVNKRFCPDTVF